MAAIAPTIVKTCRDILSQKNAVSSIATCSTDVAMASNSTSVRDKSAEESTVEQYPLEIGNLMVYAQTVKKIAKSCGHQAGLQYDEKFRLWRQKDPSACPWQSKNPELYQEALVLGLDYKFKSKKPQPFRAPLKHRYCFSSITMAHVPKVTPAPTPMFLKSVQVNTGANSDQDSNKINPNKPKITVHQSINQLLHLYC